MSGWLPEPPADHTDTFEPWRPPALKRKNREEFRYLLIDELVGDTLGLSLSPWPSVDEVGRVRFHGEPLLLGANADAFKRLLDKHRRPRQLRRRPLRIGDAFAVRVNDEALARLAAEAASGARLEPAPDPSTWIRPPIYDVTGDAREHAKSSFYSAVTSKLAPHEAAELRKMDMPPPRARSWLPRRWPDPTGWPGRTLALVAGAAVLSAGLGSGTAVGRISAPERTVALTTITQTHRLTLTRPGQTLTLAATTITKPGETVTQPPRTVTEAGATVTDPGVTTTQTITAAKETVTTESTVVSTVTTTETSVQTTTLTQTTTTTVTVPRIRTLTVTISGREGRVISRLLKIDCRRTWNRSTRKSTESGDCSARVPTRARIDLQAVPLGSGGGLSDEQFDKWLITCTGCPRNRLIFTSSMRITAEFVQPVE